MVLRRERLRPSVVATRQRAATQAQAKRLYERHPDAAGLRWWSTYESTWTNATLFERAARQLRLESVHSLTVEDPIVAEAAEIFGLRLA